MQDEVEKRRLMREKRLANKLLRESHDLGSPTTGDGSDEDESSAKKRKRSARPSKSTSRVTSVEPSLNGEDDDGRPVCRISFHILSFFFLSSC
jgi:hypothetical protein